MAQRTFSRDGVIYDFNGTPIMEINSNDSKNFAVIAKCGHVGSDYFIPIIFVTNCKDLKTAVEFAKTIPRVKHDMKGAIIDAFEISNLERNFIECINARDPYFRGFYDKNNPYVEERRIMNEDKCLEILEKNSDYPVEVLSEMIGTADTYADHLVLQRYIAPTIENGRLIYASKLNERQLLVEYFSQVVLTQGIKKANVNYMSLYYQIYGKNNPIGLVYKKGFFYLRDKYGKLLKFEIPPEYEEKILNSGVLESNEKIEQNIEYDEKRSTSGIERFKRRMENHRARVEQDKQYGG